MSSRLLVEYIHKTDRQDAHECIKAIGGGLPGCRWKHTQADAISWAEDRIFVYYVINQDGREEKVIVAMSEHGHRWSDERLREIIRNTGVNESLDAEEQEAVA